MSILKSLLLALILGLSTPIVLSAVETAEDKIEITELPAVVKEGFTKAVPGAEIKSAKKLTGNTTRYQLKYKGDDGKEHQITLSEGGEPTRKVKTE